MSNNITIKDANSLPTVMKTTDNGGVHTPTHNAQLLDSAGTAFGTPGNPVNVEGGFSKDVQGNALGSSANPVFLDPTSVSTGGSAASSSSSLGLHFSCEFPHDVRADVWETMPTTTGTVVHDAVNRVVNLNVVAGQRVTRTTNQYMRKIFGRSDEVVTRCDLIKTAGITKKVGQFDVSNGVFFMSTGTEVSVVARSSSTGALIEEIIPQASWNVDKLDGTGAGGIVDFTKQVTLVFDNEWRSEGAIKYSVYVDGTKVLVHKITQSSIVDPLFDLSVLEIPLTYEIVSTTGAGTLMMGSNAVLIEGEGSISAFPGILGSKSTGAVAKLVNAVELPIIAFRPSLLFNGATFRGLVIPTETTIFPLNSSVHWHVRKNAVIVGGAWIQHPTEPIEYNVTATGHTGGDAIYEDYAGKRSASFGVNDEYILTLNASGTVADSMVVTAVDIEAKGAEVFGKIAWKAIY